jgi:hypothetical protein
MIDGLQVCHSTRNLSENLFDACGKLNCDGIVIVAKDDLNNETNTIPRGPNKTLKTLNLSATSLDGADLSKGVTYLWERRAITPDGLGQFVAFSSTQAAVSIGVPGKYTLAIVRGTTTCTTEIAINAKPCTETPDPTGAIVCTTPALTAVADEAANRLTNLAPGDVVRCGDFNITIIEATGNANGWNGKGYVKVPTLNAEVSIILRNAVFNDCYQLTNANATAELPTVYTEYDPKWGNVVDVDDVIGIFKNLITDFNDFLKTYKGTPEDKAKMEDFLTKMRESTNNPNLIPEVKTELETKINLISTTWNDVKSCSAPTLRISAENATQEVCKLKELQDQGEDLAKTQLEPTNTAFPELNIPFRCNTSIPTYWRNVLGLRTTAPQQYPDATGFNWNITQYTLYDPNWKTNNKWWWIKEVCTPDNCENTQMYVYSPKHKDYILMYDKKADCDGDMQAMIDLADGIGSTFSFILDGMLGGPEDLAFEYGAVAIKYVGKTLNATQKAAKAKNLAKAVTLYIKESKLARAVDKIDIEKWWGKLIEPFQIKIIGTTRYIDEIAQIKRLGKELGGGSFEFS